jgi:RecB family exonuclease
VLIPKGYISKSRIETFEMCPMQYYLHYHLGIELPTSAAASLGNVIHEVLEMYAKGNTDWPKNLFDVYIKYKPHLEPHAKDGNHKCHECPLMRTIDDDDGSIVFRCIPDDNLTDDVSVCPRTEYQAAYDMLESLLDNEDNPITEHKVLGAEIRFDEQITKDIRIYGFIDLLSEINKDTIEIRDYKSGKFTKKYKAANDDIQLKIYYLAARRMFPQYDNVLCTLHYMRKKPVTVAFSDDIIQPTIEHLKNKKREIENIEIPNRRISLSNRRWSWLCKYCDRGICDAVWDKIPGEKFEV